MMSTSSSSHSHKEKRLGSLPSVVAEVGEFPPANCAVSSELSFPVATSNSTSSSHEEFVSLEKHAASKTRLVNILLLGLGLYLLDIGLHLTLASKYLSLRDCHRGLSHTFMDFRLSDLVNLNSSLEEETDFSLSNSISPAIDDGLYFQVRQRLVTLAPEHWAEKLEDIVEFHLEKYPPSRLSSLCTLDGRSFPNGLSAGAYLCKGALTADQSLALENAFSGVSRENEKELLELLASGRPAEAAEVLPKALGLNLSQADIDLAKKFLAVFTLEDLQRLSEVFSPAEGDGADGVRALLEVLEKIDREHLDILSVALGRIKTENMPEIEAALEDLDITFASFLTDPSIFTHFLSDPAAMQILLRLQELLPTFQPKVLNSMLIVKDAFDKTPGAGAALDKLFALPFGILSKIMSVRLTSEEMQSMKMLGVALQDPRLQLLLGVVRQLNIPWQGNEKVINVDGLLSRCWHRRLQVRCADPAEDLCPDGHLAYGLAILAAIALPGALFAVSEVAYNHAFAFGGLFGGASRGGRVFGRNLSRVVRWALFPFYLTVMVPLFILATTVQYYRVSSQIFLQKSPTRIQECHDSALQMHAISAASNSFLQIIVQTFFVMLLFSLGAGSLVAGVDTVMLFRNAVPLTTVSIVVSAFNFGYTSWQLQRLDHRLKGLNSRSANCAATVTFLIWFMCTLLAQVISLVGLLLITWVEVFSGDLTDQNQKNDLIAYLPLAFPFVILATSVPLNLCLHHRFLGAGDGQYKVAQAALSTVFPTRYLHYNDKCKTKKFFLANQSVNWCIQVFCWLTYSAITYATHREETGMLRIVPFIVAITSFGPFFGAVHWSLTVNPSYNSQKRSSQTSSANLKQSFNGRSNNKSDGSDTSNSTCDNVLTHSSHLEKPWLFRLWQTMTVVTRIVSPLLLGYVFANHWVEVWKPTVLYSVPFFLLVVVMNLGLHLGCLRSVGANLRGGLLSTFLPNSYLVCKAVGRVARYITLNFALNLFLQLVLWLTLSFYCWDCTQALDPYFSRLSVCFPITVGLWMFNLVLTLATWWLCIRQKLITSSKDRRGSMESSASIEKKKKALEELPRHSAWASAESSITTKL